VTPLSARQRLALDHACLRAVDAQHPRFMHQGPSWSTILSVNK